MNRGLEFGAVSNLEKSIPIHRGKGSMQGMIVLNPAVGEIGENGFGNLLHGMRGKDVILAAVKNECRDGDAAR